MSFAQRSPALPSANAGPTAADSFHGAGLSFCSWAGAPAATSSSAASSRTRGRNCARERSSGMASAVYGARAAPVNAGVVGARPTVRADRLESA